MDVVNLIVTSYLEKTKSGDWAKWEQNNIQRAEILNAAAELAVEYGLLKELSNAE